MKRAFKKAIGLLIGVCSWGIAYCQYDNMQLPKFLPPPPNAYQITKSAEVAVGLNTGTGNITIPMLEITAGGKKFPIQLNYSSNGVRVDEIASRTGINWTCNPGGVITRTVLDEDDDIFALKEPPANPADQSQLASYVYPLMPPGNTDQYNTQPDEYRFNVNGMSGKFFFDHLGAIHQTGFSNIKIVKNGPNSFTLTSPDGVIYSFGGPGATEQSKNDNIGCGRNYNQYTNVAFYLNRIDFPNGENMMLNYDPYTFTYVSSVAQTMISLASSIDPPPVNTGGTGGVVWGSLPPSSFTTCQSVINQNGRALSSMVCSNGTKVEFSYRDREDVPGEKALSSIWQYFDNQLVNIFRLRYEYSNSNGNFEDGHPSNTHPIEFARKRLFLTEVRNYGREGSDIKSTKIEYNDINGLPPRLSTAQDHCGYFNGKHNQFYIPGLNTTPNPLSMNTDLASVAIANKLYQPWGFTITSDKEPDFNYSIKGSLKRVTYPTGGYTNIEWEPNVVNKYTTIYPNPVSTFITAVGTCPGPYNCSTVVNRYFTLSYNQPILLDALAGMVIGEDPIHSSVMITIYNTATSSAVFSKTLKFNNTYFAEVNLPAGSYQLEFISTTNDIPGGLTYTVRPGPLVSGEYNPVMPGLRVKQVSDFDGINTTNVKKYNYYSLDDPGKSSGQNYNIRYFNQIVHEVNRGGYWGVDQIPYVDGVVINTYLQMQNSPTYGSYLPISQSFSYKTVVESMGDNFDNGAVEHSYSYYADTKADVLYGNEINGAPFSDNSYLNGLELQTKVFQKKSGALALVSKTVNEYTADSRNFTWFDGFVVQSRSNSSTLYQYSPTSHPGNLMQFDIAKYRRYSSWVHLDRSTDFTYDDNNNELKTIKTISYANAAQVFPSSETVTTSSGKIEETKYKYIKDYASISGLPSNTLSAVTMMLSKNMVSPLLEKSIYKDNVLLIKNRTDYKIWNSTMPLPEILSTAYDNTMPLKAKIRFHKYDAAGNGAELSKEDDMHLTYLWGYNNQYPVLEAKNAAKEELFYTSFETGSPGVADSYAKTGAKVATGPYLVNFTLPNAKQYVLTYHLWNGTKWDYIVVPYTGTPVLIEGAKIDEVRIYPKEQASVATYTYFPLIGVSSSCDANGIATYYEYDNFNRLKLIRNNDRNIVKQYQYGISDLGIATSADWQPTGPTRCKPCPANNNYLSNILQQEEKDMAEGSATSGMYRWVDVGISMGCDANADWQNTATALRCKKNLLNQNTGQQEQEQMDMNPCSSTYGQTKWIVVGTNTTACPLPPSSCNSSNCSGVDKKCVYGICETGVKIYTSSAWIKLSQTWVCTYHYHWSDGSDSQNYTENSPTSCPLGGPGQGD